MANTTIGWIKCDQPNVLNVGLAPFYEGTLYRMAGRPGEVILAREVPELLTAADAMDSQEVKKTLDTAGVKRLDQWRGIFLEEGNF